MYNGIGLATARGSGTNGYVQRNLAFIKPNKEKITLTEEELNRINEIALLPKKMHSSIIEHERKRKIEIKCLEMRELMEDQGYEADEIEEKVKSFRQMLLTKDKTKQQELINGPKFINEKNDKAERFRQVFLPDKDVKANDSDELSSHEAQDRRKGSPQDRSTRPHPSKSSRRSSSSESYSRTRHRNRSRSTSENTKKSLKKHKKRHRKRSVSVERKKKKKASSKHRRQSSESPNEQRHRSGRSRRDRSTSSHREKSSLRPHKYRYRDSSSASPPKRKSKKHHKDR